MLPSSPRARRRLLWLTAAALVAVTAALLVVIAPGAPDPQAETFHGEADTLAPGRPDVTAAERAAITETLHRFFDAGLARDDLTSAWILAAPQLRAASSRAEWLAGAVPFVEYHAGPFGPDAWHAVDVRGGEVVLELFVQPAATWPEGPAVFAIDVRRTAGAWRVASVYPQVLYSRSDELPNVFSEKDLQAGGPAAPRAAKARLDVSWLLVPALFFAGLLVALAVALLRQRRRT